VAEPPRALITGVAGQDGSYLAELLLAKGYDVWGIVRTAPAGPLPNLAAIQDRLTLVVGDLREPTTLPAALDRCRPRELYHLAADTFVPASWEDPAQTVRTIALGTTELLETLRRDHPAVRLFNASTSEVFGAAEESPQNETTPWRPVNPYGIAKLHAQLSVAAHRERYGLHASSGILYNHESPRRPERFLPRKVARGAAAIKLGLETELALGDLDARRDWGFAGDYVEAMWLMLQQDGADDYVIATGTPRTVGELVATAFAHVGLDPDAHVRVDPAFVRAPDPVARVGDPGKAAAILGWRPRTRFEDWIGAMVDADLRALRAP